MADIQTMIFQCGNLAIPKKLRFFSCDFDWLQFPIQKTHGFDTAQAAMYATAPTSFKQPQKPPQISARGDLFMAITTVS